MPPLPRYFLGFTDDRGWARFRPGKPATFGFTKFRKSQFDRLEPGDQILPYLTEQMAWCGILRVIAEEVSDDDIPPENAEAYPLRKPVLPLATLPTFKAVQIIDERVWNSLSFTRGKRRSRGWNGPIRSDLNQINDEDAEIITREIWARYDAPVGQDVGASVSDEPPISAEDRRDWIDAQIVARRGRGPFRRKLLQVYGGRCAISGCPVEAVLDAAHVTRYLGKHSDRVTNGLLLRTDLHTLYDCGLLGFDPKTRKVMIDPSLEGSEYEIFEGQPLRETSPPGARPSQEVLQKHLDELFRPTRRATTS
jgi:hypothetical protein